jgi:hypothetical protein
MTKLSKRAIFLAAWATITRYPSPTSEDSRRNWFIRQGELIGDSFSMPRQTVSLNRQRKISAYAEFGYDASTKWRLF